MIRTRLINIALRLCHVHLFLEHTMQKGIAHIQLLQRPTVRHCKSQKQSHCSWLNHRTKGFFIVQTILLKESPSYQPSLIPSYSTITVPFQLINPFASHNILIRRWRNKWPSLLLEKWVKLKIHSSNPLRISSCHSKKGSLLIRIVNSNLKNFRLVDTKFRLGKHGMCIHRHRNIKWRRRR